MLASLLNILLHGFNLSDNPVAIICLACVTAFQIWMIVHAVRQGEWVWAVFILIGYGVSAFLYFFLVYRATASATTGFELPGAHHRKRIRELQAQIHHLDKAHHHLALADIYFQQGKLGQAEVEYQAALERDPEDPDIRAHFGQCLLRQKRIAEARPLLEGVVATNPKHDYGHTLMAYAETLSALGEPEAALKAWLQVVANHSYPRAKVQLAELYISRSQPDLARAELRDVIADDGHAPAFERRRSRVWVRRARALLGQIG